MKGAVPILRSFDEGHARDFYLRYLGFELFFEHRFAKGMPLYMGVRREGCELHISEHHGDSVPGVRIRIEVDDVDALVAELDTRGHPRMKPAAQDQPWGNREVTLTDPFGNRLTFWQELG